VSTRPRTASSAPVLRPSRAEAEEAVRCLLRWSGDDPDREGLLETPSRVAKAYEEFFRGYHEDPATILAKTFEDVAGYDEMVLVRGINFESYCEHHLVPIIGVAHIGYLPTDRVVGLSKLARVVDCFAKRLQIQEKMTVDIAKAIETSLKPNGVAVVLEAEHQCMSTRGVMKKGALTKTSCMLGAFRSSAEARTEFLSLIREH
jgi:GTP cyclohydrolase I